MGKLNICSSNIRSACGDNVENGRIMFVWLNSFEEYCGLTEKHSVRMRSNRLLYWHLIEAAIVSEHQRKCLLLSEKQPRVGLEVPNLVSSFSGHSLIEGSQSQITKRHTYFSVYASILFRQLIFIWKKIKQLVTCALMIWFLLYTTRCSLELIKKKKKKEKISWSAGHWLYKTNYKVLILQTWALV